MTLAKKILVISSLVLCLSSFAGKIAIVKDPADGPGEWGPFYNSLADSLSQEGHIVDYDRHFGWREPRGYDVYFLLIDNYYTFSETKVDSLIAFVENGGRLILNEYSWYEPQISDYLSGEYDWPCYFGDPCWNPFDPLPYFEADSIDPDCPTIWYVSFATVFSPSWNPARRIDTLTSSCFYSYSFDTSGILKAVAFGGADASTGIYDSFPPVILTGRCGRGEITTLGTPYFLCVAPTDPNFDMLRFHDNCQFARQLFQCNERADSAWLVLENDSTAKVYLEHDSLLFLADSSYWEIRFTVDTIRNYSFYGHEFGAEGFGDSLAVTFRPGYFYDTVEVCLVRLPDSTGETILPCGRICDTFPERTGIAETPTPQSFAPSAHPNPFNSAVTIAIDGAGVCDTPLRLEIYDVNGRRIAQLPVGEGLKPSRSLLTEQTGGSETTPLQNGKIIWRPDPSLGSGVYLVRATAGDVSTTKRIVFLK
jgi:hypothetical protein